MSAPIEPTSIAPRFNRLRVSDVQQLERFLGGDSITEAAIIEHIKVKYGAKSLCYLSPAVADAILAAPLAFIAEARGATEIEVGF